MLLNSVILILQETLEASLLISLLMAISHHKQLRPAWLLYGLCIGTLFASMYAWSMDTISQWFDYVGQEIVNATLHGALAISICLFTFSLFKRRQSPALTLTSATLAVAFASTSEGSEIMLFIGGFIPQSHDLSTVLIGAVIGFSIGVSASILLYYALNALPWQWRIHAFVVLLALITGNMLSQTSLLLTQADWVTPSRTLWDTSHWLSENSIAGQLLYALIGYEATPSQTRVICYLCGIVSVLTITASSKNTD